MTRKKNTNFNVYHLNGTLYTWKEVVLLESFHFKWIDCNFTTVSTIFCTLLENKLIRDISKLLK